MNEIKKHPPSQRVRAFSSGFTGDLFSKLLKFLKRFGCTRYCIYFPTATDHSFATTHYIAKPKKVKKKGNKREKKDKQTDLGLIEEGKRGRESQFQREYVNSRQHKQDQRE